MTLLDMIGADSGTMLIMETPEASLDSWFMERAALMIRKFAAEGGATKLIATSNVNGTSMIPDLLGLKDGERLASKDSHRLINLMTLAAERCSEGEGRQGRAIGRDAEVRRCLSSNR